MKDSSLIKYSKKIIVVFFWLLIWELIYLFIDREIYLPSPISTINILFDLLKQSSTYYIVFISTVRTLEGLFISIIVGSVLGITCGLNKLLDQFINPIMIIVRSTPIVSIIILAIIWFKSGQVPIFASVLMCTPVIFVNTKQGIINTDKNILEMSHIFNISNWNILLKIYSHYIIPYLTSAIISIIGIAWKATTAAEVLSIPKYSIGKYLFYAKTSLDPASLFAWTLIIIFMSSLLELIFKKIVKIQRI